MDDIKSTSSPETWEGLTRQQKNKLLYQRQKALPDLFLEKHAISKEQHDKSLKDLSEKMKL